MLRSMKRALACTALYLSWIVLSQISRAETITYSKHVAPILYENCATCHRPDGIGPFSLLSYDQAFRRARQISEVTHSRFMPPWKPEPGHGPKIAGERRLSDTEIGILQKWYESGAPAGDSSTTTSPPTFESSWSLGEPDLILELSEPYILPTEGEDIYRNFVLPRSIDSKVYVRAFEMLPGSQLAIHHAILTVDKTNASRQLASANEGPGWEGMEIGGQPPAGHIVGWTPGQAPYEAYPGTAWEVEPNSDLVLQLHLLPTGRPEQIAPKIGLYFADEPPTAKSYVFQLRNYSIDIPPNESDYRVEGSIELPEQSKLVGMYPHAHYLGKDIRLLATLPDGSELPLLRIPNWDFNWQGDYRLEKPVSLPAKTILRMVYTYDNSADNPFNPSAPPVRVTSGQSSFDEMAEAMFQVIPDNPNHVDRFAEAQLAYDFELAGGEAKYHYYHGILFEENRAFGKAMSAYQTALRSDPNFAEAYCRAGLLYERQRDWNNATLYLERALAHQPEMVAAKVGLAKIYYKQGQRAHAGFLLDEALALEDDNLDATIWKSRQLNASSKPSEANALLASAQVHFEGEPEYHMEFATSLYRSGRLAEAEAHFSNVVNLVEDTDATRSSKAIAYYFLSTIRDHAGDRNSAIRFIEASLSRNPEYLEALLLASRLYVEANNLSKASERLKNLIDRPDGETFPFEDIVDHLPQPKGGLLLAETYEQLDKPTIALNSLKRSIERTQDPQSRAALREAIERLERE